MSDERWIGVDLDGTLAVYHGRLRPLEIGPPIPAMVNQVKDWLKNGEQVKIMTARVSGSGRLDNGVEISVEDITTAIQDWSEKYIGTRLSVTNEKDLHMTELWDDRAVGVVPNQGMSRTAVMTSAVYTLCEYVLAAKQHRQDCKSWANGTDCTCGYSFARELKAILDGNEEDD